jgi:hypothetical protein
MNKTKPIPVRLDDETIARLQTARQMLGNASMSAVIRFAIYSQLPEIEAGHLRIPQIKKEQS